VKDDEEFSKFDLQQEQEEGEGDDDQTIK